MSDKQTGKKKIIGAKTKFKPQVSESSRKYLRRQAKDPYTTKAGEMGYRSRAVFKLLELDEKYRLLKQGQRVVDLGSAPGGWSQLAAQKSCKVIATDILWMDEIENVEFVKGDFETAEVWEQVKAVIGDKGANLVLSDLAPNTSGHPATDHLRIIALAELARECALEVLTEGGNFACKLFQGGQEKAFLESLRPHFTKVSFAKPKSSRQDSSEVFVVALGFKG